MLTDVFYLHNSEGGFYIVEFVSSDSLNQEFIVVSYQGKEYTLYWDEKSQYYAGKVNGLRGYVL
jgi:hypothetical protein